MLLLSPPTSSSAPPRRQTRCHRRHVHDQSASAAMCCPERVTGAASARPQVRPLDDTVELVVAHCSRSMPWLGKLSEAIAKAGLRLARIHVVSKCAWASISNNARVVQGVQDFGRRARDRRQHYQRRQRRPVRPQLGLLYRRQVPHPARTAAHVEGLVDESHVVCSNVCGPPAGIRENLWVRVFVP